MNDNVSAGCVDNQLFARGLYQLKRWSIIRQCCVSSLFPLLPNDPARKDSSCSFKLMLKAYFYLACIGLFFICFIYKESLVYFSWVGPSYTCACFWPTLVFSYDLHYIVLLPLYTCPRWDRPEELGSGKLTVFTNRLIVGRWKQQSKRNGSTKLKQTGKTK